MPKERRVNSSSFDRAMVSPYSCSSKASDCNNGDRSSAHIGDEREWEEARCPICMEHPHNAVLLLCSSREKGCRPFICDTSYRHSNCLDQFRKSAAESSSLWFLNKQSELACPLCRGLVIGQEVIHPARKLMNTKIRSCSLETCSFSGNYAELRKHARVEHPYGRPSDVSPTRESNWAELEQQREMEDLLAHQSDMEYDLDGWPFDWEEWSENDWWSDGSFLDFPSVMSDIDIEDDMFSGLSLFSLYSPEEELVDSGSSRSSDIRINQRLPVSTNSASRSNNNQVGNALQSSRPRSSYRGANGTSNSRSRSGYQRDNNARSRSSYQRGNGSGMSSPRSSYRRETGTGYRSGENGSGVSRSRSSYRWWENSPTRSRRRSRSYDRENVEPSSRERSRSRSRYYRREVDRRLPGSSRRP